MPANGPMTFDELSELYRVEMKSSPLTETRKDLYRAMADLLTTLRREYEVQMAKDPDSVMTEGAGQRKRKAEDLVKKVLSMRTRKICKMAILGAEGARNSVDWLGDEERAYYDSVVAISKKHLAEVDRLRGKKVYVETKIDEPEPAPVIEEPMPEVQEPIEAVETMEEIPDEAFGPIDEEPFDDPADFIPEPPEDMVPEEEPIPEPAEAPIEEPPVIEETEDSVVIRVLEDLPAFAGPDRDYVLFKEDVVTLPKTLADALLNSGKAVVVRPTP